MAHSASSSSRAQRDRRDRRESVLLFGVLALQVGAAATQPLLSGILAIGAPLFLYRWLVSLANQRRFLTKPAFEGFAPYASVYPLYLSLAAFQFAQHALAVLLNHNYFLSITAVAIAPQDVRIDPSFQLNLGSAVCYPASLALALVVYCKKGLRDFRLLCAHVLAANLVIVLAAVGACVYCDLFGLSYFELLSWGGALVAAVGTALYFVEILLFMVLYDNVLVGHSFHVRFTAFYLAVLLVDALVFSAVLAATVPGITYTFALAGQVVAKLVVGGVCCRVVKAYVRSRHHLLPPLADHGPRWTYFVGGLLRPDAVIQPSHRLVVKSPAPGRRRRELASVLLPPPRSAFLKATLFLPHRIHMAFWRVGLGLVALAVAGLRHGAPRVCERRLLRVARQVSRVRADILRDPAPRVTVLRLTSDIPGGVDATRVSRLIDRAVCRGAFRAYLSEGSGRGVSVLFLNMTETQAAVTVRRLDAKLNAKKRMNLQIVCAVFGLRDGRLHPTPYVFTSKPRGAADRLEAKQVNAGHPDSRYVDQIGDSVTDLFGSDAAFGPPLDGLAPDVGREVQLLVRLLPVVWVGLSGPFAFSSVSLDSSADRDVAVSDSPSGRSSSADPVVRAVPPLGEVARDLQDAGQGVNSASATGHPEADQVELLTNLLERLRSPAYAGRVPGLAHAFVSLLPGAKELSALTAVDRPGGPDGFFFAVADLLDALDTQGQPVPAVELADMLQSLSREGDGVLSEALLVYRERGISDGLPVVEVRAADSSWRTRDGLDDSDALLVPGFVAKTPRADLIPVV